MTPLLAPGDHVQETDTEAAFPIWHVTVTPTGGSARQWANVSDAPFTPKVVKIGDIVRQAKGQSSRGSLSIEFSNISSGGIQASDLGSSERWEGAALEIRVVYGAVNSIVWSGNLDEVLREDELIFAVRGREGRSWLDGDLLDPIIAADWPEAPAASLKLPRPIVLGVVPDWVPPLVEDVKQTILTASMVTTDTSAAVDATDGFPAAGSLRIGSEQMSYASTTSTSFLGLVRASPATHIPGDIVTEVGDLTYLVADHDLHASTAISNVRVRLSNGGLVPMPSDVTVTKVVTGGFSTISLDRQPEVLASSASGSALKYIDLDTVAFSDLAAADALKCIGLAEGFEDVHRSILTADGIGTGGQRVASISVPPGGITERVWVVVEHFQEAEIETALNGAITSSDTTLVVDDTSGLASSGSVFLESGSQVAELVSYSAKTATTLTGVVRGLNSDHQAAASHPDGARVSWADGVVHLNLAGGDATTANTIGVLQTKQLKPEEVGCDFIPAVHEFSAQHTHQVDPHNHGTWDSLHLHQGDNILRVYPSLVWFDAGEGANTGSPELSGFSGALDPGADKNFASIDVGPMGGELSSILPPPYVNTNWYVLTFDGAFHSGDTRKVIGCDAFCALSSGAPMKQVNNGVVFGPTNPAVIPYIGFSSLPVIPPELNAVDVAPYGTSVTGLSGTWTLDSTWFGSGAPGGADPTTGDNVVLKRDPTTTTNSHDAWGADGGTGAANKFYSLPGQIRKDGSGTQITTTPSGYIRISVGDAVATTEIVAYSGLRWESFSPAKVRLTGLVRGLIGGGIPRDWPNDGSVSVRFTAHGCHHLNVRHIGLMQDPTFPTDNAPTLAQLGATFVPSIYQTNMKKLWDQIDVTKASSLNTFDTFELTVDEFFNRRRTKGNLSGNPFDVDSSDHTKIHQQYNSMKPEVVALAPAIWVESVQGMKLHTAWVELLIENDTTSSSFPTDPASANQGPSDSTDPLGVSTLSWFDVSDLVSVPADLEGATIKVVRNDDLGQTSSVSLLRIFHVAEISGVATTTREMSKIVVIDVEGAGVTAPGGTVDGAELVKQLVVEGMGQTASAVLDEASFTLAGAMVKDGGIAYHEQVNGGDALRDLAESFRLLPTWNGDGKLAVSFLRTRSNLPAPNHTFTADDVIWGSVEVSRGSLSDVISRALIRGGENFLEGGFNFTSESVVNLPAKENHESIDASALTSQDAVAQLSSHVIDYGRDVPVRVSWEMFLDGLDVLPGQIVSLTTSSHTSAGLFVEKVVTRPSEKSPALVTITTRDLEVSLAFPHFDVTEPPYNATGDGTTDDTVGIHAAIDDAMAAGSVSSQGAGIVFYPGGDYVVTSPKVMNKAILMLGEGTMALAPGASQTHRGVSRIMYGGTAGTDPFTWRPSTPGDKIFNPGVRGLMLDGTLGGSAAIAGKGFVFEDCSHATVDNVHVEKCQVAGVHISGINVVSENARVQWYSYRWGTQTALPEKDSHGLLIGDNHLLPSVTNVTSIGIDCATYNGHGVHYRGSADGGNHFHTRTSVQSGGTGFSVYFEKNPTVGGKYARRNVFRTVYGAVHSEGSCTGNRIIHHIKEGVAGAGITADVAGGAVIHYETIDRVHDDLFMTHKYAMSDELYLAASGFGTTVGTANTITFSNYVTGRQFPVSTTTGIGTMVPAPYGWSNGEIKAVRVFYRGLNSDDTDTWLLRVRLKTSQPNTAIASFVAVDTQTVTISNTSDNFIQSEDVTFDEPFARGDMITLEVSRKNGGTAAGAVDITGVSLIYQSTGPDGDGHTWDVSLPYST